jgi:hypothetical protein
MAKDGEVGGKPAKDEVIVHVLHIGEAEPANFKISPEATLQALWDEAYNELEIAKSERDTLQAVEGEGAGKTAVPLGGHLGMTLAQAIAQGLTKTRHFEIVAETGGA